MLFSLSFHTKIFVYVLCAFALRYTLHVQVAISELARFSYRLFALVTLLYCRASLATQEQKVL